MTIVNVNSILDKQVVDFCHKKHIIGLTMDQIDFLLTRGVDSIYPSKEALEKVLRSGKKLTLYQGFDPTGDRLHLGHAVGFRKLRQFQDLGHHVIFLVGDGTGLAGDPSGKMKARGRFMSRRELRDNAVSYLKQAGKIVRFEGENPVEIRYNGDWLTKLNLEEILGIAQHFSLQQMIERDMYQERLKASDSINLREFLYPLLQGYDSVAMNVDLEIGGTDQTFNMLAGRTLVKAMQNREKFVLTLPLLTDSKGTKIGKSEGNVIGLTDAPADFYGKIMALGDDAIIPCLTLLTDAAPAEITETEQKISAGANPMDFKKRLAWRLTAWLNGNEAADAAEKTFTSAFQSGEIGAAAKALPIKINDTISPVDLVVLAGARSRSGAKRLLEEKAVELDGRRLEAGPDKISVSAGQILKIGKKTIFRLVSG
jgi:tyrosyl-tRNA synthetase